MFFQFNVLLFCKSLVCLLTITQLINQFMMIINSENDGHYPKSIWLDKRNRQNILLFLWHTDFSNQNNFACTWFLQLQLDCQNDNRNNCLLAHKVYKLYKHRNQNESRWRVGDKIRLTRIWIRYLDITWMRWFILKQPYGCILGAVEIRWYKYWLIKNWTYLH